MKVISDPSEAMKAMVQNQSPPGYTAVRGNLCRRLDYCREQVAEIAIHQNLPKEDWPELAETLRKAVFSLRSCITDAEWLSQHSTNSTKRP